MVKNAAYLHEEVSTHLNRREVISPFHHFTYFTLPNLTRLLVSTIRRIVNGHLVNASISGISNGKMHPVTLKVLA